MNIVFVCVGSTKVLQDSFGPLVGTILKRKNINSYVYGSIQSPINALNLENFLYMLNKHHCFDTIIVIDTKIVNKKNFNLSFNKGGLNVASLSLNKMIGNFNITFDVPISKLSTLDLSIIFKFINKTMSLITKLNLF